MHIYHAAQGSRTSETETAVADFNSVYSQKQSLTTTGDVEFLSVTAQYRDKANNGMTRKEMIDMIMKVSNCKKWKTAENHFDYLIRDTISHPSRKTTIAS